MADFYDISSWQEQEHIGTGGTRNKAVFLNPDDDSLYYFKTSLNKGDKDYKYEFWSEIIASEIGCLLGFNVLKYDISFNGVELGCISKLMVNPQKESLIEGYRYLTGFNPDYTFEDKKDYTFQFIRDTLKALDRDNTIKDIIKIIVLDSIIGNGDRHQENWGFIQKITFIDSKSESFKLKSKGEKPVFRIKIEEKFSPIYDSGSCLGREIVDDKVSQFLTDQSMLLSYINRGKSEIHWNREKLNHFELISNVMSEHGDTVIDIIQNVRNSFNQNTVEHIVMHIDDNLPEKFNNNKMPLERKKLIIKLVTLRYEKLISII